jgi:hypothetical protein
LPGSLLFAVNSDQFDAMVGIESGLERDAELDVVVSLPGGVGGGHGVVPDPHFGCGRGDSAHPGGAEVEGVGVVLDDVDGISSAAEDYE